MSRNDNNPPASDRRPMVEVAPSQWMRFRGANETYECIRRDFFTPQQCMNCQLDLFCIQDADAFICPSCKVVSPTSRMEESDGGEDGGVALGFTIDILYEIQSEIVASAGRGSSNAQQNEKESTTTTSCVPAAEDVPPVVRSYSADDDRIVKHQTRRGGRRRPAAAAAASGNPSCARQALDVGSNQSGAGLIGEDELLSSSTHMKRHLTL